MRTSSCLTCGTTIEHGDMGRRKLYCSRKCRQAKYASICVDCGGATGGSRGRGGNAPKRCQPCATKRAHERRVELGAQRRERMAEMWGAGMTREEIADELGTTANAVGVTINYARKNGLEDFPYRYGVARRPANWS